MGSNMKFRFTKPYSIAIRGCEVHNFKSGDEFDTEDAEAVQTIREAKVAKEITKKEKD